MFLLLVTLVIALGLQPAMATVPGSPGDVDCAGQVSAADALHVLRRLAALDEPAPCSALPLESDPDGDGSLTLNDALVIRRWTAGLPVRPRLLSISPGKLTAGSSATEVVVFGGFLTGATILRWGTAAIPLDVVDDGSVAVANIPAANLGQAGLVSVSLESPGTTVPSETLLYEVLTPQGCEPAGGVTGTLAVTKSGTETATIALTAPRNMTGWQLISLRGEQTFTFPVGYVYDPAQGNVVVWSGTAAFPSTQANLWWRSSSVWSNDMDDDGRLIDCQGNQVAYWNDPEVP